MEFFITKDYTVEEKKEVELVDILPYMVHYISHQTGYKRMAGGPPPGDIARKIQARLDAMSNKKAGKG